MFKYASVFGVIFSPLKVWDIVCSEIYLHIKLIKRENTYLEAVQR